MEFTHWIVPILLTTASILTLRRGKDPYEALISGAEEGLFLLPKILPSLIALLTATGMLRASGFFEVLGAVLGPILGKIGLHPELLPLILLQPLSGSGSLALSGEIMAKHGAESEIGRIAAVLLGSSETTFYVLAVYFGAAGIKKSRYAAAAALIGDLAGCAAAVIFANFWW